MKYSDITVGQEASDCTFVCMIVYLCTCASV